MPNAEKPFSWEMETEILTLPKMMQAQRRILDPIVIVVTVWPAVYNPKVPPAALLYT